MSDQQEETNNTNQQQNEEEPQQQQQVVVDEEQQQNSSNDEQVTTQLPQTQQQEEEKVEVETVEAASPPVVEDTTDEQKQTEEINTNKQEEAEKEAPPVVVEQKAVEVAEVQQDANENENTTPVQSTDETQTKEGEVENNKSVVVEEKKEEVQEEVKATPAPTPVVTSKKPLQEKKAPQPEKHEDYSNYSIEAENAEKLRLAKEKNDREEELRLLSLQEKEYNRKNTAGKMIETLVRCPNALTVGKEAQICKKCAFRKSGYNCLICDKFTPPLGSVVAGFKGNYGCLCANCSTSNCARCGDKLPMFSFAREKYKAILCRECGEGAGGRRCCRMMPGFVDEE